MEEPKKINSLEDLLAHIINRICSLEEQVFGQQKEVPPIEISEEK